MNAKTFRSLEFLLVVLTNGAAWLASAGDWLDPRYATYATAGSVALYALARGLAKFGSDVKDYWRTTEFWLAVLGSAGSMIAAFDNVIPSRQYALIQAVIIAALGIANGMRKQPDVAAGLFGVDVVTGETAFVPDDPSTLPPDEIDSAKTKKR